MKLKDLKPKYNKIELGASSEKNRSYCKILGLISLDKAVKKYGDAEVLSVKDYDDTKTTSVIIDNKVEYEGLIIRW